MPKGQRKPPSSAEALAIIGFACFFAWFLLVFFGSFDYFPDSAPQALRLAVQALAFVCLYVFSQFMNARAMRIVDLNCKPGFLCAACACGSLMPVQFLAARFVGFFFPASSLLAVPAAFCAISFLISWEDAGGRIRNCSCLRYMCFSLGAGIIVFLLTSMCCTPNGAWAVSIALLVLSAVALHTVQDSFDTEQAIIVNAPGNPNLDRRVTLLGLAVNFAAGLVWAAFVSTPDMSQNAVFGVSSVSVLIVAYVLYNASNQQRNTVSLIMRVCLTGIVIGTVVPLLLPAEARVACYGIAIAVWFVHWAVIDTLLVQHARNIGVAAALYLAPSKTAANGGFALGWCCGLAAVLLEDIGVGTPLSTALFGGIALIAIMCFIPFLRAPQTAQQADAGNASIPPSHAVKVAQVTKVYGLTARESEVLDYLLQGRNAQAIAEKLVLSEHTVRTHIYNIYKKVDVHSRQELMDYVDRAVFDPLGES